MSLFGTVLLLRNRTFGGRAKLNWYYFFLGAAFLLLEVQTVSRATLLFGMTWMVNVIVISAVLGMILLANLVAACWPKWPVWIVYAELLATIAALVLVPLDSFNLLTGTMKLVAASTFLTAPAFFAGLIFIQSFAVCTTKSQALGSNLIGALVGGLLQSLSFVTGIRSLIVLGGIFYLMVFWLRPRAGRRCNVAA